MKRSTKVEETNRGDMMKRCKLTIQAKSIPDGMKYLAQNLGHYNPRVIATDESLKYGYIHVTVHIPEAHEAEAAVALVEWANSEQSSLLYYDGELELPWPDDEDDF